METTEAEARGVHQQEANVAGTHQLWKQEKAVAIRVKAEATATPDYPESPPLPHLADPPQPPVQVRPPGLLRLNSQNGSLRIVPFYNKKILNIQLRPPCTYPDSSLEFFCDIFYTRSTPSYLPRLFSPTQTGLLPYPKTLISTPEGPATMKRNRTKKMEKEKENEER